MSLNRKAISGHGIVARGEGEPGRDDDDDDEDDGDEDDDDNDNDDADDDKPNHKTSSLPDIMVNRSSQRGI